MKVSLIKLISKWLFGGAFVVAGVNHFLKPDFYLRIMPPVFPAPLFLIYASGIFEVVLGVLLFIPRFSRRAACGLIMLLTAVFPANIYMAANPQLFAEYSSLTLYFRLPLQLVLIIWAFWHAKTGD